jgi:hypothetical protein
MDQIDRVSKTVVPFSDDGSFAIVDTIEFDGALWLVPKWIDDLPRGRSTPERIVLLDGLVRSNPHPSEGTAQYVVSRSIPKAVLYGPIQHGTASVFDVRAQPLLEIDTHLLMPH